MRPPPPLPLERMLMHLQGGSLREVCPTRQVCVFIETHRTSGMRILEGNKANMAKQKKK